MDLRTYLNTATDAPRPGENPLFEQGMRLIQSGELGYQPYILADGVEVGEGQNLEEMYRNTDAINDHNVYLGPDYRSYLAGSPRKTVADKDYFRTCNRKYRFGYELVTDLVAARMGGDISGSSFLEVGCNSGLNLFNLAVRGAASCTGVDWTDHGPVFGWLNSVLGTSVAFKQGAYDNLTHTIPGVEVPQADVVINTVFINHQYDPIAMLCYLADRARKGLFLWVLLDEIAAAPIIRFGDVSGIHDLGAGRPLPLNLHNGVVLSPSLLEACLRQLGFDEIEFIVPPADIDEKLVRGLVPFRMVWARRTHDRPSAFALAARDPAHPDNMMVRLREAEEAALRAQRVAEQNAAEAQEAATQAVLRAEAAEQAVAQAKEAAEQDVAQAREAAEQAVAQAKEAAEQDVAHAKEAAGQAVMRAQEAAEQLVAQAQEQVSAERDRALTAESEAAVLRNSRSFRLGRFITWPLRLARRLL